VRGEDVCISNRLPGEAGLSCQRSLSHILSDKALEHFGTLLRMIWLGSRDYDGEEIHRGDRTKRTTEG
jgi:hypothetical protein